MVESLRLSTVLCSVCTHTPLVLCGIALCANGFKWLMIQPGLLSKTSIWSCLLDITMWMSREPRFSWYSSHPTCPSPVAYLSQLLAIPSFYLVRSETVESSLTPLFLPHILKIHRESKSSHPLHCYYYSMGPHLLLSGPLWRPPNWSASTHAFTSPYPGTRSPFTLL